MASQSHGFDNTIVFGKETEFGVPAPDNTYGSLGVIEEFSPEENRNIVSRNSLGLRAPFMLRQGTNETDASVTLAVQNGKPFAFALGHVDTVEDTENAGNFIHTIRPTRAGEQLPSFTAQNHNALLNWTRNYVGGKFDSFTLTASSDDAVTFEGDILFATVEDSETAPVPVVLDTENYFMFYEGFAELNNQPFADVTNFELEIANNLERRYTLNGKNRADRVQEGNLEITASLTVDLTNTDVYNQFANGEDLNMKLTLQDQYDENHKIVVELLGGKYDSNAISLTATELQEQELEAVFTDIQITAYDTRPNLI
ncbi:hypothetical protein ANDROMEDA_22 [Bacillus phage Andromeda]|uniref:Tail tube protein n=2 Tax=Andromedavirus TaxID=1623275 RepID=M1I9J6_9CAUD|nr:minor tail protein [Bacillus phage Andromeda]YP_007517566.1 minor tail protein [Bacillus phage Curly]AGE60709.1 major tail protein [Bacillus phage Curly]AGE61092.1 hypothetical protein ANDROMEDA_22 [Bacillus phage Andromeda]